MLKKFMTVIMYGGHENWNLTAKLQLIEGMA